MIVGALQWLLLALIAAHLGWTVIMHACTWRHFRRRSIAPPDDAPAVAIIKPTKGVDQAAFANFASFCEQRYAGEYELLFCVEDPLDPAVPVIKQVIAAYPQRTIRLIFSDPYDGRSFGKLKNMIAGVAASAPELIIFSDSDARVGPNFLAETVACMRDERVGIGFGAPAYTGAEDWAAALQSAFVNGLSLRITTLHVLGVFHGAIGTTMIVRRSALQRIGGLERLGWQIADDIQLARLIRQQGYRIHLLHQPARVAHYHDRFGSWWAHVQRWLVIIRHAWPALFVLMHGVDLALWWSVAYLIIALAQGEHLLAAAPMLVVITAALVSNVLADRLLAQNRHPWRRAWVAVVHDLLRLPLLMHACVTNEIVWRGRTFRVAPDGNAVPVEPPTAAHEHA